MEEKTILKLKPEEYKSYTEYKQNEKGKNWSLESGIIVKQDKEEIVIPTTKVINNGFEIEVKINKKGIGKVKYLNASKKKIYYKLLTAYIILIEFVSLSFLIYESSVYKNFANEGSRADYLMFPAIITWLTIAIILFRKQKGFIKWVVTILSYIMLLASTSFLVLYLIEFIKFLYS